MNKKTNTKAAFGAAALSLAVMTACSGAPEERTGTTSERQSSGAKAKVWGTGGIGLNVRAAPSTASAVLRTLPEGADVTIQCQGTGESIDGDTIWDQLVGGGWASDAFVYTGYDGFAPGIARCSSSSSGRNGSTGANGTGTDASGLGAAIAAKAESYDGVHADADGLCNEFSTALGRPCEQWCSDFVNYVWQSAGANVDGITAYSGTIYDYGIRHGTFKSGAWASGVKPGDAVLYGTGEADSRHVAIVSAVNADGTLRMVQGNFWNPQSEVYEGTFGRDEDIGAGPIYGYVSPVR